MSDASEGPGWWFATDGKWYPPDAQPQGLWQSPKRRPVGFFFISLLAMAGLIVVAYFGLLLNLIIPPKAQCNEAASTLTAVVSSVEAIVPVALALGGIVVCAVLSYRRRYLLVTSFYSVASIVGAVLLVWWIIAVVTSPDIGQQPFCGIEP